MRFLYKARGAITVFLILIMLPLFTVAVLLVDGARYQSAKTIIQEAGDMAAYSTISNYNSKLKDQFGLFAIDDKDVNATFNKYFRASLGCEGAADKSYSEKIHSWMTGAIGGNEYKDAKFFDLYDFEIINAIAEVDFDLANPDVLQSQIVEFMKYRGVETILERLEIIANVAARSEAMQKNQKLAEGIEELSDLDTTKQSDIYSSLCNLATIITNYNQCLSNVSTKVAEFEGHLENEMVEMAFKSDSLQSYRKTRDNCAQNLLSKITAVKTAYDAIGTAIDNILKDANEAKTKYLELREKYSDVPELVEDIDKELVTINKIINPNGTTTESLVYLKSRLKYPAEEMTNLYAEVLAVNGRFEEAHKRHDREAKAIRERMEADYAFEAEIKEEIKLKAKYFLDVLGTNTNWSRTENLEQLNAGTEKESAIRSDASAKIDSLNLAQYTKNFSAYSCPQVTNAYDKRANEDAQKAKNENVIDKDKNYKDFAKNTAEDANGKTKEEKKEEEVNVKLKDEVFKNLPSRLAGHGEESEKTVPELNDRNGDESIEQANSMSDQILSALETGRDEIFTMCYIFDMFKTRVTAKKIGVVEGQDKKNYKDTGHNEWYHVKWRYQDPRGEIDSRDRAKNTDVKTVFNSKEIEYIFTGSQNEATNGAVVYSWIYGTRLANNIIAVYLNNEAKLECEALGAACSAATLGSVPPAVFKWVFIAAWAAGETALELTYLIDDGYRVPLIKTKDLYIGSLLDMATLISDRKNLIDEKLNSAINVSYEDYLLILLCFVGREKRLLRTADLIQLNMNGGDGSGSFAMNKAFTYVKCNTEVKMKYLFQPIKQFTESYNGTGINVKNQIFQGY